MSAHAGQKRAAGADAPSKAKKTRFVDPDDDPAKFAEQVDASLEGSGRKGGVKNEGYDSDSTDDGESVVKNRRKGDDEEDDMFATEDKEEEDPAKKPAEKFMRLGDIEGQEFNDEDEDSADEDEPLDEDDAERRKKAGMGFELSSFNMREEMEDGKFTEDGTYVRTFDPHKVHDRWMDGLDDREIKRARRRKKEQEKKQRELQEAEERELQQSGGKPGVERDLLAMLKKGETVLEALQRLGAKNKKQSKSKDKDKSAMDIDKSQKAPSDVEKITGLASLLMSFGDADAYSRTYEELVRNVRASSLVDADWQPPSADIKYEYKWASPTAGETTEVFGPFAEEEIKSWYNASYFGSSGENVLVRQVGGEWGLWQDVVN